MSSDDPYTPFRPYRNRTATGARRMRRLPPHARLALLLIVCVALCVGAGAGVARAQAEAVSPATPDAAGELHIYLPLVQSSIGAAAEPAAGSAIPSEYIVLLQPAAQRAAAAPNGVAEPAALLAQRVLDAHGGTLLYTYASALDGFAALLTPGALAALEQDQSVALIEPNLVVALEEPPPLATADIVDVAADPAAAPASWGLDRVDQRTLPLSGSFSSSLTGAGVHVYIIDSGVLAAHSDFGGRVSNGYSAIADGRGITDCNGHGTHVSATVAGATYGIARRATIHPVRVFNCKGQGSTAGVLAAIDWVTANHIKPAVANMSLGSGAMNSLDAAVSNAIQAGVTFAVAAGNSNNVACNYSPARLPAAITVAAATGADARAPFSNYGACVDLFAPGVSIPSAWYTGVNARAVLNGTSMATPHVAGAAALYLQSSPSATPAAVATALISAATSGRISSAGNGTPNRLLYTAFAEPANPPAPAPVPPAACSERVTNGNFEAGRTSWLESSARGYALICNDGSCAAAPAGPSGGVWRAWLGGSNRETAELRQTLSLPAGQGATLSYAYWLTSTDYCGYDFATISISEGATTAQLRKYSLCRSNKAPGWRKATIDLSAWAGKTVTLQVRVTTDSSYSSQFFVDDLSIKAGSSCALSGSDAAAGFALELETVSELAAEPGKPAEPDVESER